MHNPGSRVGFNDCRSLKSASVLILALFVFWSPVIFGCGGGGAAMPGISLSGGADPVGVGTTRMFTVTVRNDPGATVSWAVQEPDGGTITQQGLYTAPAKAGVYHVVASIAQNPAVRAVAVITVQSGGIIGSVDFPATGDLPVTIQ